MTVFLFQVIKSVFLFQVGGYLFYWAVFTIKSVAVFNFCGRSVGEHNLSVSLKVDCPKRTSGGSCFNDEESVDRRSCVQYQGL